MPKPRTASEEFQALWDELDELRREKGIEQKKIAERSGFKRAAWFTYRKRGSIPFHLLERVAQELGARIEAQVVTKSSHGASVTKLAGKAAMMPDHLLRRLSNEIARFPPGERDAAAGVAFHAALEALRDLHANPRRLSAEQGADRTQAPR